MSVAFAAIGSGKPVDRFKRYLREQTEGRREVLVALIRAEFAGYVTVNWSPDYAPLAATESVLGMVSCARVQTLVMGDDLVLHFVKRLRAPGQPASI